METLPAGRHGLLLEFPDGPAAEAFHAELLRRREELDAAEIVPGARTVLLDGVPDPARLAERLSRWEVPPRPAADGPLLRIPVHYDGPDLAEVARMWGVPESAVGPAHAAVEYRVAFCGFAPGFGYLTGLPPERHVPRRDTPRTRVPAGAVALAGPYTGIYPRSSPGGWQLVGRTDLRLWDPERDPAALLAPGTRVRFVPVGPEGEER